MRRTLVAAVVIWCHVARADAPPDAGADASVDAPVDAARVPDAATETVSADDLRDVLSSEQLPKTFKPGTGDVPPTGTFRIGLYHDSDQTTVVRSLASLVKSWGSWWAGGTLVADVISSASVDVRSAPMQYLPVDTVTTASGRSTISNGSMEDQRYQGMFRGGWKDRGRAANGSVAIASENDYFSLGGGVDGAYDVLDRAATLLGGLTITDDWITSSLPNPPDGRKLFALGVTLGGALVASPTDRLILRYDGRFSAGFQSSFYRQVRFGDWTANFRQGEITFANTIDNNADGVLEHEPETRNTHAAVFEWLHSFVPGLVLHPEVRLSHDSWAVDSVTAAADLRYAAHWWRLQFGYRLYLQSRANFFEDKYLNPQQTYSYWTSDRNLGDVRGQALHVDYQRVLLDADNPNDSRMLLNIEIDAMHDRYPGFILLPELDSIFASIGITWEL